MASTTFPHIGRYRHGWHLPISVNLYIARIRAEWQQRQTERILERLPPEIRKDIGWPASDEKHP